MDGIDPEHEVVLVINAGSSSIKFSLFHQNTLQLILHGEIQGIPNSAQFQVYNQKNESILKQKLEQSDYAFCMEALFDWIKQHPKKYKIKNIGHRIVHGGKHFKHPTIINDKVLAELKTLIPLAPLHQPHNIEAIELVFKIYPNIAQVGCFDTSFHRSQDHLATLFAIPRKLTEEGIIRYGFHGLSYEYIASILPEKIDTKRYKKIIVAHLGQGSSMCALFELKSVATTMSFTALDGLMMGTRCGAIDPGVILYLLQEKKLSPEKINNILYNESGLLGVSGVGSDVRDLLKSNKPEANEAIDLYCYRAARELSSLITAIKGCDAIVFTAGIGENSSFIRQKICHWLDWLEINLDEDFNNQNKNIISKNGSKVLVAVIPTNEELMIAKHTKALTEQKRRDH